MLTVLPIRLILSMWKYVSCIPLSLLLAQLHHSFDVLFCRRAGDRDWSRNGDGDSELCIQLCKSQHHSLFSCPEPFWHCKNTA